MRFSIDFFTLQQQLDHFLTPASDLTGERCSVRIISRLGINLFPLQKQLDCPLALV